MKRHTVVEKASSSTPLVLLSKREYKTWLNSQSAATKRWLGDTGFSCDAGTHALVPASNGSIAMAVAGIPTEPDIWSIAQLPHTLPKHAYKIESHLSNEQATQLSLGWALGCYTFTRYKKNEKELASLVLPKGADKQYVFAMSEAIFLARDLINTPAGDMLPTQLSEACVAVAKQYKAKVSVLAGEDLLKHNYPTVYTVGKGSSDPARVVDIRFGKPNAPKVTLVGKGVCFDSGGLDIKSAGNMRLMKKDMAGVAIMLALGSLVMQSKLNVSLRLLLPMAENAVDGRSMRPLDVIKTRKGITVEVGDTDAEGRLVMCDALAEADSEKPDLIIDCSTLTGAARVALGLEIPAFFTPDDKLASQFARCTEEMKDPLYRLPLWGNYLDMMKSHVADISNDSNSGYAGAITAALFLKEFVENTKSWLHLDMMAWNPSSKPGRPLGAEAQGIRALYRLLEERYG